jgi:TetR/AcrR family transcriptional regulator, cholesterol catabolism regulator
MATPHKSSSKGPTTGAPRLTRDPTSYDRKLDAILRQAAAVFCARGYHQASIRDIARATGVSLAGLYYYFSSKEELLYLIQRHAFETILTAARQGIRGIGNPEERLRELVRLHLRFFLEHPNEMKVLTHEEQWLGRERGREVRAIKRAYYKLWLEQVEALKRERQLGGLNTRLAVLALFGMMNWIYTWYNPRIDPGAPACAGVMAGIFLQGILAPSLRTEGEEAAWPRANGRGALARRPTARAPRPANGRVRQILEAVESQRSKAESQVRNRKEKSYGYQRNRPSNGDAYQLPGGGWNRLDRNERSSRQHLHV